MKKIKIAINGFGRIGRAITKLISNEANFEIVVINDICKDINNVAYLYKYDSVYGITQNPLIIAGEGHFKLGDLNIKYTTHSIITDIPLKELGVDILIESSGSMENIAKLRQISDLGIKTIVTNSPEDSLVDNTIIWGLNENSYKPDQKIVASSICDANALAHLINLFDETYRIESGMVTTVHPWLSYQKLVDSYINESTPWGIYSLGRSSVNNLIPKDTSAMSAVEKVLPHLKNKIGSFSYRVPTDIVSSSNLTLNIKTKTNLDEVKQLIENFALSKSYIYLNKESLTSIDFKQTPYSAIVDMNWIKVINDNVINLVLWYDNEWGYVNRVKDLVKYIAKY